MSSLLVSTDYRRWELWITANDLENDRRVHPQVTIEVRDPYTSSKREGHIVTLNFRLDHLQAAVQALVDHEEARKR